MPVVANEKYDQFKIERLKNFLEDMAAKGQGRFYEIFVDSLKVVPKTDDVKEFDNYERYMDENTEKLRIVIYGSAMSPRNDQYCYSVQSSRLGKELNGLGEIENIVQEKLAARDREYELAQLRKELEETKKQLTESEEYADGLFQRLELEKTSKYKLGNINIAEFASVALEGIVRRNPQLLLKLPGGETLAGIIEQDNVEKQQSLSKPAEETGASFQKKTAPTSEIKPEHLQYIPVLEQLQQAFTAEQLDVLSKILNKLSEEPANITTVAALLNIQIP